jgi:serine/threonine protein kinase
LAIIEVNFDEGGATSTGPYLVRTGRTRFDERVAQRLHTDAEDTQARDRLGVEVEIGEHLWRSWPEELYPDQLCQLLCSNLDAKPPFVLVTQRGEPLPEAGVEPRIEGRQAVAIIDGVIRGLLRLHQAGVVCYFGEAALRGRELNGTVSAAPLPWRAPEPGPGLRRIADPRDDVYSGALVLFWLLTGERPDIWSDPPLTDPGLIADAVRDRLEPEHRPTRYDESVRRLLQGAFTRRAVDRVDAHDLALKLRAYRLPRPDVIISDAWDRTERRGTQGYRAEFRELTDRQQAFLVSRPARPHPPARPVPGGRLRVTPPPDGPPPGRTRQALPAPRPRSLTPSALRMIVVGTLVVFALSIVIGVVVFR